MHSTHHKELLFRILSTKDTDLCMINSQAVWPSTHRFYSRLSIKIRQRKCSSDRMTQSLYQTVLWSTPVKSDIIKKHWKHSWDATDVLFMRPFNRIKKVRSLQGTTFGGSGWRPSPPCISFSLLKPLPCNYNCPCWIFSASKRRAEYNFSEYQVG